jgi:hypothetical protein
VGVRCRYFIDGPYLYLYINISTNRTWATPTVTRHDDARYLVQLVHDDVSRTWQSYLVFPPFLPFPTAVNLASVTFESA